MAKKIDDACLICDETAGNAERLIRFRWHETSRWECYMELATGPPTDADWFLCSKCIETIKELTI